MKRKFDQGCQDKHHVYRVSKSLLVLRVIGTRSIEHPPVISLLCFKSNFPAVGIASMQKQLACCEPARVQVGKITTGAAVLGCVRNLVAHQYLVDVEPHTR